MRRIRYIRRKCSWSGAVITATISLAVTSAQAAAQQAEAPFLQALPLEEPVSQHKLAPSLREVSGLAILGERLFAHNDEDGVVVELDPTQGDVLKWIYLGPDRVRGDFEGIAAGADGKLVLVTSGGTFASFRDGANGERVPYTATETTLKAHCEIEGLTETRSGRLLAVCKTNRDKALRKGLQIFAFDPASGELDPDPVVQLTAEALKSIGVDGIRPSGIVELPTGHLLVLAARERIILELDGSFRPVAWAKLRKRFHRQPEGIAVTAGGDLLIADEGGRGRARLTRYTRRVPN